MDSRDFSRLSVAQRELLAHLLADEGIALPQAAMIASRPHPDDRPLSFAQERLWFLHQWEPQSSAYNLAVALRLSGPLHVTALEQGLHAIVQRHEILRITFAIADGQPQQVLAPSVPYTLTPHDVQCLPPEARLAEAQRLASIEARQPFDLATGPLLRATLLRLAPQEHVLLLTRHHIVSDAWSFDIFMRELSTLYAAFCAGQPSPLAALPLQYADFAHWQRQWLRGDTLATQLAYWQQQLSGELPVLDLPTDRPRPAIQALQGAIQTFILAPELRRHLHALSQREGVTLFMTLLAAFQTLLYRYTGQQDLLVGTPIAGRQHSELEGLIGFFVNTLVLRTTLESTLSFRELLHRVRGVALGAYDHQDVPFEKLVEALHVVRDPSRNPLFQVMFVLQNMPQRAPQFPGLQLRSLQDEPGTATSDLTMYLKVDSGTSMFDLTLYMAEYQIDGEETLKGWLEYDTALFDAATITRLLGHFQTLLAGAVSQPEQRLAHLPLLTPGEWQQIQHTWNATQVAFPQQDCLHTLFEAQAARTPEAVALRCGDTSVTYRRLNQQANQLAHSLRRLGVRPEARIGIAMARSLEMVISLLAILKTGAAYVPLDPTYPKERLAFMLHNAQVSILLTHSHGRAALPTHGAHELCLDRMWDTLAQESTANLATDIHPEQLAYVIYTSGSTGTPKGVLGLHRSTVNRLAWMWETYPFGPGERCCQKTSLNFVDSVWEIFGPLLAGVESVIIPDDVLHNPRHFVQTLATQQVTRLLLVPSLLRVILDTHPELQQDLPHLRHCVTSGEACAVELAQRFRASMPQCVLLNLYGSSEVAADATWCDLSAHEVGSCVPIGRPISNTQVYVLDAQLSPVPVGIPGELYVGGAGLARGYLGRPDWTAERFIPHPFSAEPGARLYRTGDVVRYLPDGNLEFLRRADYQIKLHGFRIELQEIEAALWRYPGMREAVVLARPDERDEVRLVAYVVLPGEPGCPSETLRSFVRAALPEYMVPSLFVFLDTLPLLPNGKVDRTALPRPTWDRPAMADAWLAPETPLEMCLATIWRDVLAVERVGKTDNFFDLGGNSLLSMVFIARVEQQLGVRLTPRDVIFQTLGQLAAVCAASRQPSQAPGAAGVTQRVVQAVKDLVSWRGRPTSQSS